MSPLEESESESVGGSGFGSEATLVEDEDWEIGRGRGGGRIARERVIGRVGGDGEGEGEGEGEGSESTSASIEFCEEEGVENVERWVEVASSGATSVDEDEKSEDV